ncbi:MAG: formylglycine-generating enzyme family protein [Bryobacterales bacterium]|nr:formylglycine-generating enzyme family protein [Bryobacterales bacterium]
MRQALTVAAFTATLMAAEPGMVFIPGGEFQQGRAARLPDTEVKWYPTAHKDDQPARRVTLDPFYLNEGEVTNEAYAAFAKATRHRTPYHWRKGALPEGKERHPVVNVSWDDAAAYCEWRGRRLPTEAEWERAARGHAEGALYAWGDREPKPTDARYNAEAPLAVCSKAKNYFGLCDMTGNVWEWTADWYSRAYYAEGAGRNPTGPESGLYRVLRGGSWFDQPGLFLMVSYRSWARPGERSATIGFRCAKDFGARPKRPRSPMNAAPLSARGK